MTIQYRASCPRAGVALAALAFAALTFTGLTFSAVAHAQEPTKLPARTQLPQQVLPTGAEDAPQTSTATTARSAAPAADLQALQSELVRMTSESDAGLKSVNLSDGSKRVDLDGRFMSVLVATPTSDGDDEITCHSGKDALTQVERAQRIIAGKLPKPTRTVAAISAQPAPAALEEK